MQGDCGEADSNSLELLSDGLLCISRKAMDGKREGFYGVQVEDECGHKGD